MPRAGNGATAPPRGTPYADEATIMRAWEDFLAGVDSHPPVRNVDVDPRANGRTYGNTAFVCGDAALAMAGLAKRLQGRMAVDPGFAADFAEQFEEKAA